MQATQTEQHPLESATVPQADDLDKVRTVVAAAVAGSSSCAAIAEATGFSTRHVEYRVRAATLLGLLRRDGDRIEPSRAARALLDAPNASEQERRILQRAASEASCVRQLAPDLFSTAAPSREALAERIERATSLSRATALRRAGTLLSWRRRLRERQLALFEDSWM